jgi:arylsulfatase
MSFDYGSRAEVTLPMGLAHAMVVRPPAEVPVYQRRWDVDLPASVADDLADAPAAVREYAEVLDVTFGAVPDEERWREGISFYLNCLRDVDRHIGVVLDALEATGQADSTVVIFTADHGEMAGSHGLRQKANLVYDENFHVPLIVKHPDHGALGGSASAAMASAVDLAPTLLEIAGADAATVAEAHPALHGHSLVPAFEGRSVREGVLTAVESITTLDSGFWRHFGEEDAPARMMSGELRPDWTKRGFLRGYTDERYSFGRYFAALEPNRPDTLDALYANNDVVLYDRVEDPHEMTNLAADEANAELVDACRAKLERLISDEIGADDAPWVTERPNLLGWPTWRGDQPVTTA